MGRLKQLSYGAFGYSRMPRYQEASSLVTIMASGHGWTGSSGVVLNDTTDFVKGLQSASMPTPGDGGTYNLLKTGLSLNSTGKQVRLWVKFTGDAANVNVIRFWLGNDTGYTNAYSWDLTASGDSNADMFLTPGKWLPITLNFASATSWGSPTRTGIVAMKVAVRDLNGGAGKGVTMALNSVELINEPSVGYVSLAFDDGYDAVWSQAMPKMAANGLRGTVHIIDDLLNTSGRLTTAQVNSLRDLGWEICAHSHVLASHTSTFSGMTAAQLDKDLAAQKNTLRAGTYWGQGTAYPQGVLNATSDGASITDIVRRYYPWARTTYPRHMETFPPADPMRLRARSSISSFAGAYAPASVSGAGGDIDKAVTNKGWWIGVFHNITTPITAGTQILQADFDAIVDKVVSSGATCAPVGEVLSYL